VLLFTVLLGCDLFVLLGASVFFPGGTIKLPGTTTTATTTTASSSSASASAATAAPTSATTTSSTSWHANGTERECWGSAWHL